MRILGVVPLLMLLAVPATARAQGPCVTDLETRFVSGKLGMSCEFIGTVEGIESSEYERTLRRMRMICDGQNGFLRLTRDGRFLNAYCCTGIEDRPPSNAVVGLRPYASLPGRPNPEMPPLPVPVTEPNTTVPAEDLKPQPPQPPPPPPPPPPRPTQLDCESRTRVSSRILLGNAVNASAAEALRLAKENAQQNAERDAQRVLAGYECAKPCRKDYTLDVRISRTGVVLPIGTAGNVTYSVMVFAVWDMDILCVRVP